MFFLFFIGNFDIFYCSNYFILFFYYCRFYLFCITISSKLHQHPISSRLILSPITNKINYLGVTVQNKKDCFKLHKKQCLSKARHRSNLMPAVIATSCNKILIGKTYWKNGLYLPLCMVQKLFVSQKNRSQTYKQKEIKPSDTL